MQITSSAHLRAAVHHAALAGAQARLRTRTVHSEIVWALNATNNVRPRPRPRACVRCAAMR